jgi:S1-C subfamily serine protease
MKHLLFVFFFAPWLVFTSVAPHAWAGGASEVSEWEDALNRVSRAVVSLRVRQTRDFDTERAGSSGGTGFVVDKERGIILTNRHLVKSGPVIAEAVFLNHEEVDLEPIYRDPVHDFGFYRFDPSQVRFMEIDEIPLRPDKARVGLDIRIVGNDSGEKISILGGTLARLDREAPTYGSASYNDFNTFYLQAASNTSGGSSGSPVVDIAGHAVALNAGARTNTASGYYLPLWRIVRALDFVREGSQPPRGTLQASFKYTPFGELRRLGLSAETEQETRDRFPQSVGMLVVDRVVPSSGVYGLLRPGDILLSANGRAIGTFVDLAEVLDEHVGANVAIDLERGGQRKTAQATVEDLYAITPDSFIEFSRGVIHDLSYMHARNHNIPVSGVVVAQPGYALGNAGISARTLIDEIEGRAIGDLNDLEETLEGLPEGARVRVRVRTLADPRQAREVVLTIDRTWHPARRCTLRREDGTWPCTDIARVEPSKELDPNEAPPVVAFPTGKSRAGRALARSLVTVHFEVPYPTAGIKNTSYRGPGLIIDTDQGLILTDRDTVPVLLGDLHVSLAGQLRLPARVVYLHPVHNLAVLRVDPASLARSKARNIRFVDRDVEAGRRVRQVALDTAGSLIDYPTRVAQTGSIILGTGRTPRYRDVNLEGFALTDSLTSIGGVIADRRGRAIAAWLSFMDAQKDQAGLRAMPAAFIRRVVEPLVRGKDVDYRALGVDLGVVTVAVARERGLSEGRVRAVLAKPERHRRVLEIRRVWGGTPAEQALRAGDLIVEIEGRSVSRMLEIEELTKMSEVSLIVLRDGEEVELRVPTTPLSGRGVDRIVQWSGLILHEPHLEVAVQGGERADGVYAAWAWYGSPAFDAGIRPTRRLVEVNGESISDLDDFLDQVSGLSHGEPVRITTAMLDGRAEVHTLKFDSAFWPTWSFAFDGETWQRVILDGGE